jgi:hypothetical protein
MKLTKEEREAYDSLDEDKPQAAVAAAPQPAAVQLVYSSAELDKKRIQLEGMRLDAEMAKISKPDTSLDYFKQMLEIQKNNFDNLLAMQRQQNDLNLKIKELELAQEMGGEEDSTLAYLQFLKPFLPAILASMNKKPAQKGAIPEKSGGEEMKIPTAAEQAEFKRKIQAGEISEEQAYEEFKKEMPAEVVKSLAREDFTREFEKIKNGK